MSKRRSWADVADDLDEDEEEREGKDADVAGDRIFTRDQSKGSFSEASQDKKPGTVPNSASEAPPTSPGSEGEAKEPSKPEKPAPKKADKKPKSVYVAPALNATEKSQFEKIMA